MRFQQWERLASWWIASRLTVRIIANYCGTKSVEDIPLTVNYLPDNITHIKLLQLAEDQKRAQFKITYYTDGTHTEGYYAIYNAFISSSTTGGDKDAVVVREFVLSVDGGPLATGLVE
ncbi:hypothetical protein ACVGDG_000789 [Escherichia coli]|uniref:hypothetical protein n=1 Tax=Escherichia coli TaxID=562 RepID=UPI000A4A23A7|nr:hypothetical protein [Escherichia coli]MEB6877780.1 hypothetical protein [Escherichia coli]CAD6002704.1 unnamed protein product [Escherichia coli]